jgi:ubiquinone/menaquinone biosynthesis C-methylase UbiE
MPLEPVEVEMTMKDSGSWETDGGPRLLRKAGMNAGDTVLDFGCGTGTYTIPAAIVTGEMGRVYALDKDREKLDELMRDAASRKLRNIFRVENDGSAETGLEDESADFVILYDVIHLIGWKEGESLSTGVERKRLYEEVRRVAKPGAKISVFPNHLKTHTDISTPSEARDEITESGFLFQGESRENLFHDGKPECGTILGFRKPLYGKRGGIG